MGLDHVPSELIGSGKVDWLSYCDSLTRGYPRLIKTALRGYYWPCINNRTTAQLPECKAAAGACCSFDIISLLFHHLFLRTKHHNFYPSFIVKQRSKSLCLLLLFSLSWTKIFRWTTLPGIWCATLRISSFYLFISLFLTPSVILHW